MKFLLHSEHLYVFLSPPARGAWIEIAEVLLMHQYRLSPPARGAWIEIYAIVAAFRLYGVSPPARGAWIEMHFACSSFNCHQKSPPARGAWIEIGSSALRGWLYRSPPARGAWIEMKIKGQHTPPRYSRPPHGGRGLKYAVFALYQVVGGRPPHGGRGLKLCCVRYIFYAYAVAPRTGGVD